MNEHPHHSSPATALVERRPADDIHTAAAARLIAAVDADPWGSVRPSPYETARVLSSAPWLPGERTRIDYLLGAQAADGSWGDGPAPYRLLPTLSAVEAVLAVLERHTVAGELTDRLAAAAARGLAALADLPSAGPWPDTAAAEILVPGLVAAVNERLDRPGTADFPHLGPWRRGARPVVPGGYHAAAPEAVAAKCRAAGRVPFKLNHTFEGISGHLPESLLPAADGLLGSSPAATAAWLTAAPRSGERRQRAIEELTAVAHRYGGLLPEAAPITVFERLWVAAALARPGLPPVAVPTLRTWVDRIHHPEGVRGAPGLMVDADDTAMTVLVAALVDRPRDPAPLAPFDNGRHYDCYLGEDTGSLSANAHAVQALQAHLGHHPEQAEHRMPVVRRVADWMTDRQLPDGHWTDKWHASPYYVTERCVTALAATPGPRARQAVRAAADWVLATQHRDGSWGIWGGTAEETAYAAKILLRTPGIAPGHALDRAETFLHDTARTPEHQHPALWHDKTLYAPDAMIQAEVLAARHLLRTRHETEHRP
ncbi:prenyltransferase/squalene oxidase repeat-containing protein [Streptomyces sp. TLI_171]|uniref:prenyltransferase/squalene oxidase repeat-containing protein n=1 Tax=Streptomyces sp. TLI_171 TaxID=1938859 RepID=UPI000C19C795|nr:prenyltransferase/squalene oxidase repeat-containing protein [Streptomyces sp. TLI_171]RKE17946.1 prenyltransferase/squalene oxidase-like repeat protein [Streptomyces sp. TLI_171]